MTEQEFTAWAALHGLDLDAMGIRLGKRTELFRSWTPSNCSISVSDTMLSAINGAARWSAIIIRKDKDNEKEE